MRVIFNTLVNICMYIMLFCTLPLWLPFWVMSKLFNAFPALAGAYLLHEILGDDEQELNEYGDESYYEYESDEYYDDFDIDNRR